MNHEREIISTLIKHQTFYRKFGDKVFSGFFEQKEYGAINELVEKYFKKYTKIPTENVLLSEIDAQEEFLEKEYCDSSNIKKAVKDLFSYDFDIRQNKGWLKDKTMRFIQGNLLKSAFVESYDLIQKQNFEPILDKFKEVFSISFDDNLGLEYFENLEERYDRMSEKKNKITTGISYLDKLLGGGWFDRTLNVIAGPANAGKTMWAINFARSAVTCGKNVVYFTFEIPEDEVGKRMDAIITKTKIAELLQQRDFVIEEIKRKKAGAGQLIVKDYTPRTISSNTLSAFIQDLEQKNGFKVDMIVVDYLSLMNPNNKMKGDSLYQRGMEISIELRAMAYEFDIPVMALTQLNRQGFTDSAPGMENTGESIAIPQTADTMIIINRNEEYDSLDQVEARVVKSRFSKNGTSTLIGVDYDSMTLYNLDHENPKFIDEVSSDVRKDRLMKSQSETGITASNYNADII